MGFGLGLGLGLARVRVRVRADLLDEAGDLVAHHRGECGSLDVLRYRDHFDWHALIEYVKPLARERINDRCMLREQGNRMP